MMFHLIGPGFMMPPAVLHTFIGVSIAAFVD
jgi:hypothetical protein